MRIFTVEEANSLIPYVRKTVGRIQTLYAYLAEFRESAQQAAVASEFGGGMEGGADYVKTLYEVGKLTTELHTLGIQLKDYSLGLVDFPSQRDDRVVLLCWKIGEGDEIEWWHELEAGYAGRKPL